jgi:glycosyltransferase involved in cell wall biosynthesis
LISIIIPTYKKPKSIIRCLDSCKKYLIGSEIIVIVDDDDTNMGLLKEKYPDFKIVRLGNMTGAAIAMWKGVLISSGDIVGFIGDDTEFIVQNTTEIINNAFINVSDDIVVTPNDGISNGRGHPFMFKKYWLSGGGYPPCYKHYYGDTELQRLALYHNKRKHIEEFKLIHHHVYSQKLGNKNIDVIEDNTVYNRIASRGDGEIFKVRMEWWNKNNKPRIIPYNIGI